MQPCMHHERQAEHRRATEECRTTRLAVRSSLVLNMRLAVEATIDNGVGGDIIGNVHENDENDKFDNLGRIFRDANELRPELRLWFVSVADLRHDLRQESSRSLSLWLICAP